MSNQNPCDGAGAAPSKTRLDKGECPECGRWYKLTGRGKVRQHPERIRPKGFTPADEDLELPPEQPSNNGAPVAEPPTKLNRTPDLDDEQYMEQLFLIAQAIAVMPGQRDGMPNVTTPPPIRPRWAAFLISLGMRITPEFATHRLVSNEAPAMGNWGPRERVQLGTQRTSMNRADMAEMWKRMNPESYEGVQNGTMTREQLWDMLPTDLKQAMQMAQQLREQEIREEQERAKQPPERFDDPT